MAHVDHPKSRLILSDWQMSQWIISPECENSIEVVQEGKRLALMAGPQSHFVKCLEARDGL